MPTSRNQALALAMDMKDALSHCKEFDAHIHRASDIAGLEEILHGDLDAELAAAAPDKKRIKALFDLKERLKAHNVHLPPEEECWREELNAALDGIN